MTVKVWNIGSTMTTMPSSLDSATETVGAINKVDFPQSGGVPFNPSLNGQTFSRYFAGSVSGEFMPRNSGTHSFQLCSEDGTKLFIDGTLVINHDGRHRYCSSTFEPSPPRLAHHKFADVAIPSRCQLYVPNRLEEFDRWHRILLRGSVLCKHKSKILPHPLVPRWWQFVVDFPPRLAVQATASTPSTATVPAHLSRM